MSTTLHEDWVKDAFANNGQPYTAFGPQDKVSEDKDTPTASACAGMSLGLPLPAPTL